MFYTLNLSIVVEVMLYRIRMTVYAETDWQILKDRMQLPKNSTAVVQATIF